MSFKEFLNEKSGSDTFKVEYNNLVGLVIESKDKNVYIQLDVKPEDLLNKKQIKGTYTVR